MENVHLSKMGYFSGREGTCPIDILKLQSECTGMKRQLNLIQPWLVTSTTSAVHFVVTVRNYSLCMRVEETVACKCE